MLVRRRSSLVARAPRGFVPFRGVFRKPTSTRRRNLQPAPLCQEPRSPSRGTIDIPLQLQTLPDIPRLAFGTRASHREAALAAMRALAFVFLYLAAAARAPVAEQEASGRRRLFSREQVAKLTALGGSVAIDGNTLVVGASEESCEDTTSFGDPHCCNIFY
mgnify:CR=1 FL=1